MIEEDDSHFVNSDFQADDRIDLSSFRKIPRTPQ